ncbi:hypothetical protein DSM107133_01435 [Pseudosulfitobacter sp. DSM 107133]|nr:hypothetical protein DSM107133_01435 [Pseudosulfitobacter sp. DSM 107133]
MPCKSGFCVTWLTQNAALGLQGGAGAKLSFVKLAAKGGNEPESYVQHRATPDRGWAS